MRSPKYLKLSQAISRYLKTSQNISGLLLAILGEVFDVTKGRQHYEKGASYNCFAGRDGSRAFVTGEFEGEGLTDNVEGMSAEELDGILGWRTFYRDTYTPVGVLAGRYYGLDGEPVGSLLADIESRVESWKANVAAEKEQWPPCNSRWAQGEGNTF
eukprot:SAG31_NODE_13182_length_887_cov_1.157360_1_plen_156_part_10